MEKSKTPQKNPVLNFKPVTDGLGFHPFSDGLPYAPVSKNSTSKHTSRPPSLEGAGPHIRSQSENFGSLPSRISRPGLGATAAGPASFATGFAKAPPRVSIPIAASIQKSLQNSKATEPSTRPIQEVSHFGVVYMLRRIAAISADTLINVSLCTGSLAMALWFQDINPELLLNPGVAVYFFAFLILFNWAILVAQEMAFGTTVGKRFFRLVMNGNSSAIFLRAFFFLPSLGFCGLGIVWALFERKRRCWHDLVVDLQPTDLVLSASK